MAVKSQGVFFDIAALIARLAFGIYFCMAGLGKVRGEFENGLGSFYRGDSYTSRRPEWLPDLIAAPHGYALPWLELIVGALIVVGLFTRTSSVIAAMVLLSIAIAMLSAGQFFGGPPFHHSGMMLTLALLLAATGPGRLSVDQFIPAPRRRRAGSDGA